MSILKPEQRPMGPTCLRFGAALALALVLAACGKDEPDPAAPAAGTPAGQAEEAPPQAVSDAVAAMSAEELSEAAGSALRDQRLYAPAGNNAMEYYLALRDKQPQDPAVASALTDLMPYTLIATEQAIGRGDFAEAQRLYALMEKTDANAPALPRLEQSIASAQEAAARQAEQAAERTEQEAARQQELAAQREREQQQAQQQAAQQLAAQQAAARQAEEQRQAEQRAAAQRQRSSLRRRRPPRRSSPARLRVLRATPG
jgi:periplasmic protein TonB